MNLSSMLLAATEAHTRPFACCERSHDARVFVEALAYEALTHRAVRHPYLRALASGELPDLHWALADFARHYVGYSQHFRLYLGTVLARLEHPRHRASLRDNLAEESGCYDDAELMSLAAAGLAPEWFAGVPHPQLFRRFCTALGVEPPTAAREAWAVVSWREDFMQLLRSGGPAMGVGAIGLGTENIVSSIHAPICTALARMPELSPYDTVFFPLHTAVDDHHTATLTQIAVDLAGDGAARHELRMGMHAALNLRVRFWDWLFARALDPTSAR